MLTELAKKYIMVYLCAARRGAAETMEESLTQILWDWNGTILDDVEVCRAILNDMLDRRGLAPVSQERYRAIFTFPIRQYYRLAGFDFEREAYGALADEYMRIYPQKARRAKLAAGAEQTLRRFREAGIRQTIISACETTLLREQAEQFGVAQYFDGIYGAADCLGGGKEAVARCWLAGSNDPTPALFVGDTLHDCETARAIGCRPVLVSFGHQGRDRLEMSGETVIDSFEALYPIVFGEDQMERSGVHGQ